MRSHRSHDDPVASPLVPILHRVASPIAKEAFPLTKATSARGGGELNVKHNTSLWAALGFNCIGALCVSLLYQINQPVHVRTQGYFFPHLLRCS